MKIKSKRYFITKPTILYCIKDFDRGPYSYYKNKKYSVNIHDAPEYNRDGIYFIINNTGTPLILAKTSLYNTIVLEEYFINILEERRLKLEKLNIL